MKMAFLHPPLVNSFIDCLFSKDRAPSASGVAGGAARVTETKEAREAAAISFIFANRSRKLYGDLEGE
jgi:hypothetical protein